MKTLPVIPSRVDVFPEQEIRSRITAWWDEKVDERQNDPFATDKKNTLYQALPIIDSLEIVNFTLVIEGIIDQEIPAKFIRRGGYDSSEEMLKHLIPQLRKLYETKKR